MAKPRSGPTPLVLVVDDEVVVLEMMERALLEGGFAVHTATSGPAALEFARELPGPLDLVVTDIRMEPMDGVTLAARLHEMGKASRFLFVTGFGVAADYDPRFGPLLPKPFSPHRLVEAVTHLLF